MRSRRWARSRTLVTHVDFLSADSHKWMLGPMAAGIVYVREELQERLRPTLIGAWNVHSPQFIAQEEIVFEAGARRYEPGVLNMAGILGMKASIELLMEAGIENVGARLLESARVLEVIFSRWALTSSCPVKAVCLPVFAPRLGAGAMQKNSSTTLRRITSMCRIVMIARARRICASARISTIRKPR